MPRSKMCFEKARVPLLTQDKVYKLLVVGASNVGKTSLIFQVCDRPSSFTSTIGVDFQEKSVDVDGECVRFQLWDTAGHEHFRTLTLSFYSHADGILLVYDISRQESFENVCFWAQQVRGTAANSKPHAVHMLIGNKCDLAFDAKREVPFEMAEKTAKSLGMPFCETSAKTGENVEKAFYDLATTLLARRRNICEERCCASSKRKTSASTAVHFWQPFRQKLTLGCNKVLCCR